MATVTRYTKTFEGLPVGDTAASLYQSTAGTAEALIVNPSPAMEGTRALRFDTAGGTIFRTETDTTARGLVWRLFRIRFLDPGEATQINAFFNFYGSGGTVKIGDVRFDNSNRTLQIRSVNTGRYETTTALTYGTDYFLAVKVQPQSSTGLRMKLYNSSGTLIEDSGNQSNANGTVATVDEMRWGNFTAGNIDFILDDVKGDDSTELTPTPPASPITANAGSDQSNKVTGSTVTLPLSATGGNGTYTYSVTQTAGTSVTLSGTGNSRTFTVPTVNTAETLTFQLTVTDSGGNPQGTDSVNVGILAQLQPNAGTDQTGLEPFDTITLSGSGNGGGGTLTPSWSQISGTTVTLSGTGYNRTFTAPATTNGTTMVFRLTLNDSLGSPARTDDVSISVLSHDNWYKDGSTMKPFRIFVRNAGAWT